MSEDILVLEERFSSPDVLEVSWKERNEVARKTLTEWIDNPELTRELLDIIDRPFDYDSVLDKKIPRMVDRSFYLVLEDSGVQSVHIPDFFNYSDRMDGQCLDLTYQLLTQLSESNVLEKMRDDADKKKKPAIIPILSTGKAPTHFNTKGSNHVWLELKREDDLTEKSIVVDPSFRILSPYAGSGFVLENECMDPTSILGYRNAFVYLGIYDTDSHSYEPYIDVPKWVVLGSSKDSSVVYELGFVTDWVRPPSGQTNQYDIAPVIRVIPAVHGNVYATAVGGQSQVTWFDGDLPMSQHVKEEVGQILKELQKARFLNLDEENHDGFIPYDLVSIPFHSVREWENSS